ncbi:MAG TPA: hypothetical protein VFF48_10695 [Brevundimonas sp.]|nr:hypothetical protein [Brevundimonas sp.]
MNFYCLVSSCIGSTPHLEWLPVITLDQARGYAGHELNQHLMPIDAHIYADAERLDMDQADPTAERA